MRLKGMVAMLWAAGMLAAQSLPFSAEAVLESDGVSSTVKLYRDTLGRQRVEMYSGNELRVIHISDPTSNTSVVLNPAGLTGRRATYRPVLNEAVPAVPVSMGEVRFKIPHGLWTEDGVQVVFDPPQKPRVESLGAASINGWAAQGVRSRTEIPSMLIGDRPLGEIAAETWTSVEFGIVLMSRTTGPLTKETVYRVIRVDRNDPARELFVVPEEYVMRPR